MWRRSPSRSRETAAATANETSLAIMKSGMNAMRTHVMILAGVQMLVISRPLALTAIRLLLNNLTDELS